METGAFSLHLIQDSLNSMINSGHIIRREESSRYIQPLYPFWWDFSLEDPADDLIWCNPGNQIISEVVPRWIEVRFGTEGTHSPTSDKHWDDLLHKNMV